MILRSTDKAIIRNIVRECLAEHEAKCHGDKGSAPLTVEQARERKVCRICGGPADFFKMTYMHGAEYAHTACLKQPQADAGEVRNNTPEWIDHLARCIADLPMDLTGEPAVQYIKALIINHTGHLEFDRHIAPEPSAEVEVVERVARAIYEMKDFEKPWSEQTEPFRNFYRDIARAAIGAYTSNTKGDAK